MRTLLHTCCSCCALGAVEVLRSRGHEVACYFYNPNIHPSTEYIERFNSMEKFAENNKLHLYRGDYEIEEYFGQLNNDYSNRCHQCYGLRISKTSELAQQEGFDAISTTLLTSIYQDHELISDLGTKICNDHDIAFVHFDNREDFRTNQDKAKELEMYKQKYCGCIFSERERYQKKLFKVLP